MGRSNAQEQDAAPQSVLADAGEQRLSWEDVCLHLNDLKAEWRQLQTQHSAGCPTTPCSVYGVYTVALERIEAAMQAIQDEPNTKNTTTWQLLQDMKKATVYAWAPLFIKGAAVDDSVHEHIVAASRVRSSLTYLLEDLLEECK